LAAMRRASFAGEELDGRAPQLPDRAAPEGARRR
jgi:hypothetical protein